MTTLQPVAPTTGSRLVSLDILKSSGILMVLLLHTTQEAVDQGKYFGGLEALPLLYIGGMSGLFFVLNTLGIAISSVRQLKKYSFGRVLRIQLFRSGLLVFVAYLIDLFLWGGLMNTHVARGYRAVRPVDDWGAEFGLVAVSWFVIANIGFTSMVVTLTHLPMLSRGWSITKQGWALGGVAAAALVLNPVFRLALDAGTCCAAVSCRNVSLVVNETSCNATACVNGTNIVAFNAPPAECAVAYAALGSGFDPCEGFEEAGLGALGANGTTRTRETCLAHLDDLGGDDTTVSIHGIADGRNGRRWCPGAEGSGNATVCELRPWWGQGQRYGGDLWRASSPGQRFASFLLAPWFSRFGVFAYLAPALAGSYVGASIEILGGVSLRLLRRGLLLSLAAFVVGLVLFLALIAVGAADTALQAGSHVRLFCGGGELAITLALLGYVEVGPPARRARWLKWTAGLRRFGAVSLTLWALQWVNTLIVAVFDEIGGRVEPWVSRANGERLYTANSLLVMVVMVLWWWLVLWLWSKVGYVGSIEWVMAKALGGIGHGGKKAAQLKGGAEEKAMEGEAAAAVPCAQFCCCACCCWKGVGLVEGKPAA